MRSIVEGASSGPGGNTPSGESTTLPDAETCTITWGESEHSAGSKHEFDRRVAWRVSQRLAMNPPSAQRIARYMVIEQVGRGGMGMVYAAYDTQLDRKVAIKVLPEDELPAQEDRVRFQREAQALARLSHPHVVTVHEVGEADGELFLAMEFVQGQTLVHWLRTARPGWREVLEALIQAGRGLAAVHEAGLVHRDLKPSNIMRRDDGMVKILDFGLARAVSGGSARSVDPGEASGPVQCADSTLDSGSELSTSLTRTGTVMGTPGYMSPEQLRGDVVDARSDQFSFCVTLYEALYGERPYPGRTLNSLSRSVLEGRIRRMPKDCQVPARLRTVLLRGLATDPAQRWPSMEALVEQLHALVVPRVFRWLASVGLGLAAVVGLSALCEFEVLSKKNDMLIVQNEQLSEKNDMLSAQNEQLSEKDEAAAVSPDGRRLVVAAEDASIWSWELRSGKTWVTVWEHNALVRAVAFSPDGMRLSTMMRTAPEVCLGPSRRVVVANPKPSSSNDAYQATGDRSAATPGALRPAAARMRGGLTLSPGIALRAML
ncbi:MAG: serine/threonine-protein kinase [Myxococcota bacterium]